MNGFGSRIGAMVFASTVLAHAHAAPADLDPSFGQSGAAMIEGSGHIRSLALLSDHRLLIADGEGLVRLDASGRVDPLFAPIGTLFTFPGPTSIAVAPDGRIYAFHWYGDIICRVFVTRHEASGARDLSYGTEGRWEGSGGRCAPMGNIALTAGGEIYFSFGSASLPYFSRVVYRIDALGRVADHIGRVTGFGAPPHSYGRIAMQADGRPVIAVASERLAVARLVRDGFDVGFGSMGIASSTESPLGSTTHDVALASDGRIYAAGPTAVGETRTVAFTRFTTAGAVDTRFGVHGVALVDVAQAGESVLGVLIAAQPDGRLVFAAGVGKVWPAPLLPRIVVGRLALDGRLDATFAPGGLKELMFGYGTSLGALAVRADGKVLVAGSTKTSAPTETFAHVGVVVQLEGGDAPASSGSYQRQAVEYFHAGYGHYFVTADGGEIATLDASPSSGWTRTGATFNVWGGDDPSLARVCRFWSGQRWSPKSSHFYTPYTDECASVKQDPAWTFERDAFSVRLPEGTAGARTCPEGSRPLYRAYNNGLTGAPNHRYSVEPFVLDAMLAEGWSMEGEATTRVFACVPAS